MGTRVKDYILEINHQKEVALHEGKEYVIIRAKDLHAKCNLTKTPSVVQCCSAMRQLMLEGDRLEFDKPSKTGASMAMTIRYYVHDLDERKPMNIIKRGRPHGSTKDKITKEALQAKAEIAAVEPVVKPRTGKDVKINEMFETWAKKERFKVKEQTDMYMIDEIYGTWIIPKYKNESVEQRLFNSIRLINEDTYKCSILFKNNTEAHVFWDEFSSEVKERLNLTAFFISTTGEVEKSV